MRRSGFPECRRPYAGSVWYATQPPLKKEVRIAMARAYIPGNIREINPLRLMVTQPD